MLLIHYSNLFTYFNGSQILKAESQNCLNLHLDNNLNFRRHVKLRAEQIKRKQSQL